MQAKKGLEQALPRVSITILVALVGICTAVLPARAEDWLPVTAAELGMTAEPKAPGAPAIILYRQVDRNDAAFYEQIYVRIKILTEAGLKQANVEIPYEKDYESIRDVEARTIRPDGSIVAFDGKVYEQPVFSSRSTNIWTTNFTMPAVAVGSIIEYRFRHHLRSFWAYGSRWLLNADLFTKYARFSLEPNRFFTVRWSWPLGLPEGTQPPQIAHGTITMEAHDIPAFVKEPHMPPEAAVRLRVDFDYLNGHLENNPDIFWRNASRRSSVVVNRFLGAQRSMVRALPQIVLPGDPPEVKLRKIYARTQQIENLSFERAKTSQEVDRENPKDIHDAGDVWSRGYGSGLQITLLFVGLARAAGVEAYPVAVSSRNAYFFDPRLMNFRQLNSTIVLAKLDGKEIYLAPGVPFTPFGLLPWDETGVRGLVLDWNGVRWVETPFPDASVSLVARKANLHLDEDGAIEGKVVVTYSGLEALSRRLRERNEDGPARTQFLENDLKRAVPAGSEVTLTNEPDWRSSDPQLVAEYDLKVPGWVSAAGQYHLLTVGLFGAEEKQEFVSAERIYPLYFEFAFDHHDDVAIELPSGWRVSSALQPRRADYGALVYGTAVESAKGKLQVYRDLTQNAMMLKTSQYDAVRDFFQSVRTGDEEQIVISLETSAATR